MELYRATPEDDEYLKSLFSSQVVSGFFKYRILRPHSFFDQYRLSTEDHETFLLRDAEGKTQAMASLLFKKAYINDQEQQVGYLTDFRVPSSDEVMEDWAKAFIPIMEEEGAKRNCQFIFFQLEQYENQFYNRLLRRRSQAKKMPRYHLFRKFYLIILYGIKPFPRQTLSALEIQKGQEEDMESLCQYLQEQSVRRPLRYHLSPSELKKRCQQWPGFSMGNFLIARNHKGKIVGCMAPWNKAQVEQVLVHRYRKKSFQVYSTSQSLFYLGLTRPLSKPGQAFKIKHITHSACDNPDIFYSLLHRAYHDCQDQELLAYPNYSGDYALRPPRSFIHTKIPYQFYTLLDQDKTLPSYLHPNPFTPAPDYPHCYF